MPPSLSARRAWIEINVGFPIAAFLLSLSARRAWIEILISRLPRSGTVVALRKESVDRNRTMDGQPHRIISVALRKESVDRNISCPKVGSIMRVALRKESVDRNFRIVKPSYRTIVALRKESVDRNYIILQKIHIVNKSLSARRAWIEIGNPRKKP